MPRVAVLVLLPDKAENLLACMSLVDLLSLGHEATWLRRLKVQHMHKQNVVLQYHLVSVFWSNDS